MTAASIGRTPLLRRISRLLQGRLARASAWLFAGSLAAGVMGYVFQVLMGRMLSPAEYGLFTAVMALFAVFAAPLGTLTMVIARKVSEYRACNDSGSIRHFHRSIHVRAAIGGIVVLAGSVAFVPGAQAYLNAPSAAPVYMLALLLVATALPIINNAFLQGLQSFSWLSVSNSLYVLLKIVFSAGLIWTGHGVSGALGGTVIAAIVTWLFAYWPLQQPLAAGRAAKFETTHLTIAPAMPVLFANVAFVAMTQLDMVLVNHYFSSREAGLYAAASVLGKAVMYLPGGIALALFPMVAEGHAREENVAGLLLQAFGLTSLLCAAGALFYLGYGEALVVLLYGESYRGAGEILRYFGFAMFPMALVMVAEYFLIAKGQVLFAYLFLAVAPLQVLAIHYWHDSLQQVVMIIGVSGSVLAIAGYAWLWRALAGAPRGGIPDAPR